MSIKAKVIASSLLVVILGTVVFLMPYLTVSNMRAAAESRNAATMSSYIDFPAVRESVKATASAKLAAATSAAHEPSPFSAFGSAVTGAFIDRMADVLITPESIAMMMTGQAPSGASPKATEPLTTDLDTSMGYETPNQFIVSVKKKGSTDAPISFVLSRDRLFFWKLTALRLP